jgi:hemerythrin-like domain-containing protein/rubredoxin
MPRASDYRGRSIEVHGGINTKPIGPLMWEHRVIERIVPVLEEEINRIKKTGKADPQFIVSVVDFFRTYADKAHHGKEENILFNALESKTIDESHAVIMKELTEEHEYARATVGRLLEGRDMWINGDKGALDHINAALKALAELYPAHIEKEDKRFFHPVMKYFSHEEQDQMLENFNKFDRAMIHEKYKGLVEELTGSPLLFPASEASQKQPPGYVCSVCGYAYDPAKGDPEHGVRPGTRFDELPEDWVCPICGAYKTLFKHS